MAAPLEFVTKPENCAPFKFGPASSRDTIVHTCERPGADDAYNTPGGIPQTAVQEWVDFMQARDVKRVLTLLDDNELEYFAVPLFDTYKKAGFKYEHIPMGGPDAKTRVMGALHDAEAAGEKVVAHCTHGMGRSGRVAAAWLAVRYGLSAEDATREAMETAEKTDVTRLGDARKLAAWLGQ